MLFTSLEFLFLFFPIVIVGYFLLPTDARNYWLLIVSLFFYAWGEPSFVIVMIGSIVFNYFMALRITELKEIGTQQSLTVRRLILAVTIVVNIGVLFIFKYLNFVISVIHNHFPFTKNLIGQTAFVLPIGISFFTFQALSYVIDVYRGVPVQRNIGYIGLYISLFPQLIAGPIVRYTTVAEQIVNRKITSDLFAKGIMRFLCGFNKKYC